MTDSFLPIVADMVKEAERHADDTSSGRIRAVEYYRGEMKDTPADDGRSHLVSRDIRKHIKKALPSIYRTILGGDEVVEYQPVGEGDEGNAEQASDYVNYVVMAESEAHKAIYDAIHDALLYGNGILKWWSEEKTEVSFSSHSGLTEMEMFELASDDGAEVVEHEESEGVGREGEPITLHKIKLKRTTTKTSIKAGSVPRERLLIHPDATSLQDSIITGEKSELRRSDLVAMGYDRDLVETFAISGSDDEEQDRRETALDGDEAQRANEMVDYYDLYVRVDMDGDGIAELRHMCFAGGLGERNLLENEECDEIQMADIAVMRQPHQWEGISLADDLFDIQRTNTVLLRQTADNIYWQNNPQPVYQEGVVDEDSALNPEFGKPLWVKRGTKAQDAAYFAQVPFVANHSFALMEHMSREGEERTGVTDAAGGLSPDALQNVTAKATAMIEQMGIGQTEMMVRTIADGLAVFFGGLLRLVIRHQDKPRTIRLRGEWVPVDPRHWDASMDATVNTGLGAGTRERDMQVMQYVMGVQEKLIGAFGPDNPFVSPENLGNTLMKLAESAGLKSPRLYFTDPDPEEIKARLKAAQNQPDPEQMKIEGQMQLEQAKLQANIALEDKRMQAQAAKEKAQMDADLQVKMAEIQAKSREQADKLAADAAINEQKLAFEREKLDRQEALEREKLAVSWAEANKPQPEQVTQ